MHTDTNWQPRTGYLAYKFQQFYQIDVVYSK